MSLSGEQVTTEQVTDLAWAKDVENVGKRGRKKAKLESEGFTLIASLLLLLLMSGLAIGLMMMVTTEGKVGSWDLQNNLAYHAAESGIEKMSSDLNATFQNVATPSPSQICSVGLPTTVGPSIPGITWKDYSVQPGSGQSSGCPTALKASWGTISGSGQNAGLQANIIPVNMLVTAAMLGGQEISMTRQAQVALIPAFQFGVFSDSDLLFEHSGNLDFAGRVHTNGDLYPLSAGQGTLTFHYNGSAYGNVIRQILPNGVATYPSYNGAVYIPSTDGGCPKPGAAGPGCNQMAMLVSGGSPNYGSGSLQGAGGNPASSTYNASAWNTFSKTTTNLELENGNYGSITTPGTGAKKLSMSFVGGGAQPYELIRVPPVGEDTTSAVSQAREYNMAQIRVLLADDPTEFQDGSGWSDPDNVRLANLTTTQAALQGGNATATNPWGITITTANYNTATWGTSSGQTYNLYFAAASNAVPAGCTSSSSCTPEWPYAPKRWTANASPTLEGLQPATLAPIFLNSGTTPTMSVCPASSPTPKASSIPAGCPSTGGIYPYYSLPNPYTPISGSALTAYNSASSNAWSLIDGYLRVEYQDASGNWHPVTREWLGLGFARGVTAPTQSGGGTPATASGYTPTPNPINPNAIILLQQPADRLTATPSSLTLSAAPGEPAATGSSAPSYAVSPTCTATSGGQCTAWTAGTLPTLASDAGSGGEWAFGITPTTTSTTTPQSLTQYNWYPINFYDPREGEVREQSWTQSSQPQYPTSTDQSCTTNGVMNAVEIDVGNLKRWLAGSIGTSGTNVDYVAENGSILYFSDRRGMLLNPNPTSNHPANRKSGDSGLEDLVNATVATGTPGGTLDAPMTGQQYSPEDVNENGVLDNFGAANLGLGFYGITGNAAQNLNTLINSTTHPDPYGTGGAGSPGYTADRINNCGTTGRKNWVSGARHVLKLVDGALGNLPLRPTPLAITNGTTTTNYWGGFTVASENPVYVQGNYNSSASDTTWNSTPSDATGMAAAAVIADAVSLLSITWDDRRSMLGISGNTSPTVRENRKATTTYYRMAVVSGKNMNYTSPSWVTNANDAFIDGGLGNFLRLLEDWTGDTMNYKGSMVSLYYATYNTGLFKCCGEVYTDASRDFIFDTDFNTPYGLPPGTPMFRDVETLSYRQLFTPRSN
jgi:hypothetical protein